MSAVYIDGEEIEGAVVTDFNITPTHDFTESWPDACRAVQSFGHSMVMLTRTVQVTGEQFDAIAAVMFGWSRGEYAVRKMMRRACRSERFGPGWCE